MSGTDNYERWMDGARELDFAAYFDEPLEDLGLMPPIGVSPTDTVRQAIETMNSRRVGCVLVGIDRVLVGIFTERDVITKVTTRGDEALDSPVSEYMTRNPECLSGSDRVVHAINAMVEGGYRHVPVLADDGRALGVFGMRAFVTYLADLHPEQIINAPPPGQAYAGAREGA